MCQNYIKNEVELFKYFGSVSIGVIVYSQCYMDYIPTFNNVTKLSLSECIVTDYSSLSQFESLESLVLVSLNLAEVPSQIRSLRNLKYLTISHNSQIKEIPNWIEGLKVNVLILNDNSLERLPDVLPKTLVVLKVHNNKLQCLSPLLSSLKRLRLLTVRGNPLFFPDYSITRNGTEVIMKYLHEFLADIVPNRSIKLSVIGKERSGKTTLIHALNSESGIADDSLDIIKTDGLDIHNVSIEDISLRMFDLAGDIDYFETHAVFLSEGTLYLAVFDIRSYGLFNLQNDFLSRIDRWLSSIYSNSKTSRVILVATHVDSDLVNSEFLKNVWKNILEFLSRAKVKHQKCFLTKLESCLLCNDKPIIRRDTESVSGYAATVNAIDGVHDVTNRDQENFLSNETCFPHIVGYYEVSSVKKIPRKLLSSKNLSIEQLKKGILSESKSMIALHPVIPKKWLGTQCTIKKLVASHIYIIEYQSLLNEVKHYELNEEEFLMFLQHFHSKGELIYFSGNGFLNNFIILDPQWLSQQLRLIITYKNVEHINAGVLSHSHFEEILSHLSKDERNKLLILFEQSSLFIPFNDTDELIPCRLPLGKPNNEQWPVDHNENQIDHILEFDSLPPNFFSYLMSLINRNFRENFIGKMAPMFYNNNIIYHTKSSGIFCEIHSQEEAIVNPSTVKNDEISNLLKKGLRMVRFLSVEAEDVENLFESNRNSLRISSDFDALDVNTGNAAGNIHRVRFEYLPHKMTIRLSIMGPKPCCLAQECVDLINKVRLTHFDGINIKFKILCTLCVRKLLVNPASFVLEDIKKDYPICAKGHNLKHWDNLMTGKCDYKPNITVESVLTSLNNSQCPKLFVMMPVNMHSVSFLNFLSLSYFKEGYSVHLLCEFPDGWHFLSCPGYRINRPKEFVKRYGKRLQSMLTILSYLEVPLRASSMGIEPSGEMADVVGTFKQFASEIGKHLEDFKDEFSFTKKLSYNESWQYIHGEDGLHRRELCRFLNKIDEEKRFGDLIPTVIGEKVHWLCEEHHMFYQTHD